MKARPVTDVYVVVDLDYDAMDVVGVFLDPVFAERFVRAQNEADRSRVFQIQHWHVAGATSKLIEPRDEDG